jgi:DNA-binding protein H-NS
MDILADLVRGPSAPSADEPVEAAPPVRYRHPVRGCTWDGHGVQPQWLRDALLQEGYLLHQLRCAGNAWLC